MGNHLEAAKRAWATSPLFASVVVVGFACAIGLNAAVFTVSETIFLPEAFPDAETLLRVGEHRLSQAEGGYVAPPAARAVISLDRLVASAGVMLEQPLVLSSGHENVEVDGGHGNSGLFKALGVRPAYGTLEQWGIQPYQAVISHSLWQEHFGGDPAIVGTSILLNGGSYDVIAIMPPGFSVGRFDRAWIPLDPTTTEGDSSDRSLLCWVRLAEGVPRAAFAAALEVLGKRLADEFPDNEAGWTIGIYTRDDSGREEVALVPLVLHPLLAIVLLVAATNGAGFILASNARRQTEFSTRAALGARTSDIVRLVLIENGALVVVAGAGACLVAAWLGSLLVRSLPLGYVPPWLHPHFGWRGIVFVLGATALVLGVFTTLPALAIPRGSLLTNLQEGAGGVTQGRASAGLRRLVLIGQVAATTLLAGLAAGLLVSYQTVVTFDRGYDPQRVLAVDYSLPSDAYQTEERQKVFVLDALDRLAARATIPFAATGPASVDPESLGLPDASRPEDRSLPLATTALGVVDEQFPWSRALQAVNADYFVAMGIPLRGRTFTLESRGEHEAVLSRGIAELYWGSRDPVGDRFRIGSGDQWFVIVGVADDVTETLLTPQGITMTPRPMIFVSAQLAGRGRRVGRLLIGPHSSPLSLAGTALATLTELEPNVVVLKLGDLTTLDPAGVVLRWAARLCVAVALVAAALAAIGLAASVTHAVQTRRREIGIRLALGATDASVSWLLTYDGLRVAYIGVMFGIGLSVPVSQIARVLRVGSSDHLMGALLGGVLVLGVSGLASFLPARRAASVDAMFAIRSA